MDEWIDIGRMDELLVLLTRAGNGRSIFVRPSPEATTGRPGYTCKKTRTGELMSLNVTKLFSFYHIKNNTQKQNNGLQSIAGINPAVLENNMFKDE